MGGCDAQEGAPGKKPLLLMDDARDGFIPVLHRVLHALYYSSEESGALRPLPSSLFTVHATAAHIHGHGRRQRYQWTSTRSGKEMPDCQSDEWTVAVLLDASTDHVVQGSREPKGSASLLVRLPSPPHQACSTHGFNRSAYTIRCLKRSETSRRGRKQSCTSALKKDGAIECSAIRSNRNSELRSMRKRTKTHLETKHKQTMNYKRR
jgi:hypothetical protein